MTELRNIQADLSRFRLRVLIIAIVAFRLSTEIFKSARVCNAALTAFPSCGSGAFSFTAK